MLWAIIYVVGNTYKTKYIKADTGEKALKRSRLKNAVAIYQVKERKQ